MWRPALLAVLSLVPILTRAAAPAPLADATANRHLGFFLRLDGGVGFMGTSAYIEGLAASVSGVSIPLGVTVGGAVAENLILAGEAWYILAPTPVFDLGGRNETASDSGVSLLGAGPNLTYYFMPDNVYVSVTLAIVHRALRASGTYEASRVGFGAKIAVGEEWWVSDHWGIGVAAQFFLGLNQGTGIYQKLWTTLGGGMAFSATFN